MNDDTTFFELIEEICEEKGIDIEKLSFGWIRKLTKGDKVHMIVRYEFDINSAVSYQIAGDKYATYACLKNSEVPIIEQYAIFSPITRKDFYYDNFIVSIKLYLDKYKTIVIKPHDSCKGKDVYKVSSVEDALLIIERLFNNGANLVIISPYVDIKYEYRVVILDDEVLYIYKKEKAYVIGDGKSTLQELINKKEEKLGFEIEIDDELNLEEVIKKDEKVIISWKHNLCNGATPIKIDKKDKLYDEILDMAIKAAKAIGIRFCTVDITQNNEDKLEIMEINGSVCMNIFADSFKDGRKIVKDIYAKAIDRMFEE